MGPPLSVRYNREIVITVKINVVKKPDGTKMSVIFVRYSREFVITVIVITEFDCSFIKKNVYYSSLIITIIYNIITKQNL